MVQTKWILAATVVAGLCARTATAQERLPSPMLDAPKKSLELGVGVGYSQGTGQIVGTGERVSDVARSGGEAVVDIGYRFNERWMLGGYTSFGYFRSAATASDELTVRGVTAGAQGQYHFRPMMRWDPYIGFGMGYRGIFASPNDGPVAARHGIQLARFRLGLDVRASTAVALGPVVGVDATMFTAVRNPGTQTTRIGSDDLTVAPFFFAGLAGRFDMVNERVPARERTMAAAF
jgi:opacity protein-like surface antigen